MTKQAAKKISQWVALASALGAAAVSLVQAYQAIGQVQIVGRLAQQASDSTDVDVAYERLSGAIRALEERSRAQEHLITRLERDLEVCRGYPPAAAEGEEEGATDVKEDKQDALGLPATLSDDPRVRKARAARRPLIRQIQDISDRNVK